MQGGRILSNVDGVSRCWSSAHVECVALRRRLCVQGLFVRLQLAGLVRAAGWHVSWVGEACSHAVRAGLQCCAYVTEVLQYIEECVTSLFILHQLHVRTWAHRVFRLHLSTGVRSLAGGWRGGARVMRCWCSVFSRCSSWEGDDIVRGSRVGVMLVLRKLAGSPGCACEVRRVRLAPLCELSTLSCAVLVSEAVKVCGYQSAWLVWLLKSCAQASLKDAALVVI